MTTPDLPGRDPRAVCHPALPGRERVGEARSVAVVGGGIAGLSAAAVLAERGVDVTIFESTDHLGGRVASWPTDGGHMSRGFHAFFRQYYNLRRILRRADPDLDALVAVPDYPLQRGDGLTDSFAKLPASPPWSIASFVWHSPTFPLWRLAQVNVSAAMELVNATWPEAHDRYDHESAAAFLDRLRFPEGARHLALEVFARSFFAHPEEFSAGELVAMFHTYFTGSAEGLLFDVPSDDFDTALWSPLGRWLAERGVIVRTGAAIDALTVGDSHATVTAADGQYRHDAVVLAADPRATRHLVGTASGVEEQWARAVTAQRNAPPFVVWRLWLDRPVAAHRPAFLGTSGYDLCDNVSVLELLEDWAAQWRREHGGSVVELHAYAVDEQRDPSLGNEQVVRARLLAQLHRLYPETIGAEAIHQEYLRRDDCPLIDVSPWRERPGVATPHDTLVLAGDAVRCEFPVALMERAATTGIQAANRLLHRWGAAGEDVWSVPLEGIAAPGRWRS